MAKKVLLPDDDLPEDRAGLRGPRVEEAIRVALLGARSLADEVHALVCPLGTRNQWYVLGSWSYFHRVRPSQQDLIYAAPPHWQVTRQRVAQVISGYEQRLAESRFRPGLLTYALDLLENAGGVLPTPAWLQILNRADVVATEAALRVLPALGEIGLTPPVQFHDEARVWLLRPAEADRWSELTSWAREARRAGRSALRHYGAIPRADFQTRARFGHAHLLEVTGPEGAEWIEAAGFLVPKHQGESRLSRHAKKILAVACRPVSIRSIVRGVRQPVQTPVALPSEAALAVLGAHHHFQVRGSRVRWRGAKPERSAVLNSLETAFVDLVEKRGGEITSSAIKEWLIGRGASVGFVGHLCRAPYIRRVERGLYVLRGRQLEYQQRRRHWQAADRQSARPTASPVEWIDDDTCTVTYPAAEVRASGALWLPGELVFATALAPSRWTCVLPSGATTSLQYVDRRLVGLRSALRAAGAGLGSTLRATFLLAEARVEMVAEG